MVWFKKQPQEVRVPWSNIKKIGMTDTFDLQPLDIEQKDILVVFLR